MDYRVTEELKENNSGTVYDVENYLKRTYATNVTVEFEHVKCEKERLWLYENYERCMNHKVESEVTNSQKVKALQLLLRAQQMELYLQKRHPTHKRYSGEGSEALRVALNTLISKAGRADESVTGDSGIDYAVLGMPHRGRLSTLVVLNDYPMRNLLHKVAGNNDIPE